MSNPIVSDLRLKPIFQLSDDELRERLRPAYEAMKQKAFNNGSYITYYDPRVCPTDSHAVHEYSDRKELIWMDDNFKERVIKTL
jgi:hypothetical protein